MTSLTTKSPNVGTTEATQLVECDGLDPQGADAIEAKAAPCVEATSAEDTIAIGGEADELDTAWVIIGTARLDPR